MPTVIGRPNTAVPSEQAREARQAGLAVARLAPGFARDLRDRLVREILARLAEEKRRRQARNLNHWEEHVQGRIDQIAEQVYAERNARIGEFLKGSEKTIREYAWRITRDWDLAERAIVQTCLELWEGRTHEKVFLRALKMNARDALLLRNLERARFESLDTARAPRWLARAELLRDLEVEADQEDFASQRADDQDPLEILERREEIEAAKKVASSDWRLRWIFQKEWGKALGIPPKRPGENVTKVPAPFE